MNLEADVRYIVVEAGKRCPLNVGEVVTRGNGWTFDFMAGGVTTAVEVVRENGERVTLHRGPETGALLRAESRSGTGDRRKRDG